MKVTATYQKIAESIDPKEIVQISEEERNQVEKLIAAKKTDHSVFVDYFIGITGKQQVYHTLWVQHHANVEGPNPEYLGNLSTDLITSVQKAISVVGIAPLEVDFNNTRRGLLGNRNPLVINFGSKHRGKTVGEVYIEDPGYIWYIFQGIQKARRGDRDGWMPKSPELVAEIEKLGAIYKETLIQKNRETSKSQHLLKPKDTFSGILTIYNIQKKIYPEPYGRAPKEVYTFKLVDDQENKYTLNDLHKHWAKEIFPLVTQDKGEMIVGTKIKLVAKVRDNVEWMGVKFTRLWHPKNISIV